MSRWEKAFYRHHSFFICKHFTFLSLFVCTSRKSLVHTKFMFNSMNFQHRLPEKVCLYAHTQMIIASLLFAAINTSAFRSGISRSFRLSVCVSVWGLYVSFWGGSEEQLWLELLKLLHPQILVLDDALIPLSLAEAQHNGSAGPINKLTQGVKGGCSWGWLRRTVHQLVTLADGLFLWSERKIFVTVALCGPPTGINQISTMNKVAAIKWLQRGRPLYSHSSIAYFIQK